MWHPSFSIICVYNVSQYTETKGYKLFFTEHDVCISSNQNFSISFSDKIKYQSISFHPISVDQEELHLMQSQRQSMLMPKGCAVRSSPCFDRG